MLLLVMRPVVKAATAFTVAHSLTLIGSTLGLVGLAQAPVEALIALSIVFMGVEIVKRDPDNPSLAERAPWVVAFLFGLIHGFGFAGALREIGLPESDVPTAHQTLRSSAKPGSASITADGSTPSTAHPRHRAVRRRGPCAPDASAPRSEFPSHWIPITGFSCPEKMPICFPVAASIA